MCVGLTAGVPNKGLGFADGGCPGGFATLGKGGRGLRLLENFDKNVNSSCAVFVCECLHTVFPAPFSLDLKVSLTCLEDYFHS